MWVDGVRLKSLQNALRMYQANVTNCMSHMGLGLFIASYIAIDPEELHELSCRVHPWS